MLIFLQLHELTGVNEITVNNLINHVIALKVPLFQETKFMRRKKSFGLKTLLISVLSDRQTFRHKYRQIHSLEKTEAASLHFDVRLSWE